MVLTGDVGGGEAAKKEKSRGEERPSWTGGRIGGEGRRVYAWGKGGKEKMKRQKWKRVKKKRG